MSTLLWEEEKTGITGHSSIEKTRTWETKFIFYFSCCSSWPSSLNRSLLIFTFLSFRTRWCFILRTNLWVLLCMFALSPGLSSQAQGGTHHMQLLPVFLRSVLWIVEDTSPSLWCNALTSLWFPQHYVPLFVHAGILLHAVLSWECRWLRPAPKIMCAAVRLTVFTFFYWRVKSIQKNYTYSRKKGHQEIK